MQYLTRSTPFSHFRLLISGLSQSGKTTSLPTFVYGPHDYFDDAQQEAAVLYAADNSMVIIECPGETGHRSLPDNTPHITSYYTENTDGDDTASSAYSVAAIKQF